MQPQPTMAQTLLEEWVAINSGTDHLDGLATQLSALENAFGSLGAKSERLTLPARTVVCDDGHIAEQSIGQVLRFIKREDVKPRILFVGHMDTVFPKDSPFQQAERVDADTLVGPGSADMKGGLVVMLEALKEFEASDDRELLGWEVIITSDEEVGSPVSKELLTRRAKEAEFGLIFEPSLPDGTFVSARKGSATLSVIAKGKAAHAGREHHLGRNAISALTAFLQQVETLHDPDEGTLINVGHIQGGTSANVVPDHATAKVNIRADHDVETVIEQLKELSTKTAEGTSIEVVVLTLRPPKPFDEKTEKLFTLLKRCGDELGIKVNWQPSGGVCDGNFLAAAGLPTIDTLGVVGGNLHTTEEYVEISSIEKRIQLTVALLKKIALGEVNQ